MFEFEKIKINLYLFIPIICIAFWAIFCIIHNIITINSLFILNNDFYAYREYGIRYMKGDDISQDPHLPFLGLFLGLTVSLLPLLIAELIWFIIIFILAILFTIEYNKIIQLMGIESRFIRFIFLMVVSNGWLVYGQFYQGQFKYILGLTLLYIIRQEIELKREKKLKNLKTYIINYTLIWFCASIYIPVMFFFVIYFFYDIGLSNVFKKKNIKIYLTILLIFALQNYYFFLNPSYIYDFINLYTTWHYYRDYFPLFYLREWVTLEDYSIIHHISMIYISIITIILILKENIKFEYKLAYLSLFEIIFFAYAQRALVFLIPLVILLYIPFLKQEDYWLDILKQNKIIMIGLISILLIALSPPYYTIFKYFPSWETLPYCIFIYLRFIFLLSIFLTTIGLLYLKENKNIQ